MAWNLGCSSGVWAASAGQRWFPCGSIRKERNEVGAGSDEPQGSPMAACQPGPGEGPWVHPRSQTLSSQELPLHLDSPRRGLEEK